MDNLKIKSFTDLKTWQEGHRLVIMIYKTTRIFPKEETYSLVDQMRRAATSVTSNIAEGFGRQYYKEKVQFYYLAQGSLTELKNQILIAKDVGYLPEKDFLSLLSQADLTHQLLQGLLKKSRSFINSSSGILNLSMKTYYKHSSENTNSPILHTLLVVPNTLYKILTTILSLPLKLLPHHLMRKLNSTQRLFVNVVLGAVFIVFGVWIVTSLLNAEQTKAAWFDTMRNARINT